MAEFDHVIPPGQEGKINLEVLGEKVSKRFDKSATVFTNDPDHPRMTISLVANILNYVDVEPTRVYLRGMFGESVSKDLTISSTEMKGDLEILEVSSNIDDKITYKVVPEAEPGKYTIKLFKNPKLPTLNTWGSVAVKTNSEKTPLSVVQVNVVTRGAIVVQPTTLNFGAVKTESSLGDMGVEKELTIFKLKGEFNITDIVFSSDNYKATIEPVEEGKRYKITVGFHPGTDQQSYVDEMVINTDDPTEPAIRIRLLARGV